MKRLGIIWAFALVWFAGIAIAQNLIGGQQIHNLPPAQPLQGSESIPIDQGVCTGCTVRTTPQALATYINNYTFTFSASQITSGTLACARLPTFTGAITTSGCSVTTLNINGTTVPANGSSDQTIVTTAPATGSWASLPSCVDQSGQHLNYNTSTHAFSCGTTGGTAGSVAFSGIGNGTNTSSTMVVGSGASLSVTGSGTISATTANSATTATTATSAGSVPATGITGVLTNAQLPTTLTANTTGNAATATTAQVANSVSAANVTGRLSNSQLPTTLSANTTGNAATATTATSATTATTATTAVTATSVPASGITGTLSNTQLPSPITANTTGTAAALAGTPTQCPSGQAPQGIAANGNVQGCQAVGGGGTGSVTSVSVVSANGLAGSVANPTSTPAITLSTPFTGIAYANGSGLSAAAAGNFPTLNQSTTGNAATATNATSALQLNNGTVPTAAPLLATNSAQQLTPIVLGTNLSITGGTLNAVNDITSSGATIAVTAPSAGVTNVEVQALGTPTSGNATNLTNLQSSALTGTIPYALIPGSSVRYPNAASVTIVSGDNGNVVNNNYSGASSCTLPAITTGGIVANAYQVAIFNSGSGAMSCSITGAPPTTTINFGTTLSIPANGWAFVFADADNSSSGNYNYTAFTPGSGSSGAGLGANTFTGNQTISKSAPQLYLADTAQSGTNITDWGFGTVTATNGQMCLVTLNDAFTTGNTGICVTRGASGTYGANVTNITFGGCVYATGCGANNGGTYTFTGTGTASFAGGTKAAFDVVNGIPSSPTSGQGYAYQPATHQYAVATDTTQAFFADGLQNLNLNQELVSYTPQQGLSYPTVSWSGTGCSGPTDTTGASIASTFTNGSSTISGTNSFVAGMAVSLIGTNGETGGLSVPSPFSNGTIYYVTNITGAPTGTTYQLSATAGTSGAALGPVSGITGSGSVTITVALAGNYLHEGGLSAGNFTVPSGGTYVTACIVTLTFPHASVWGKKCRMDDEGGSGSNMTQTGHTALTASFVKASAPVAGDVLSYLCEGY